MATAQRFTVLAHVVTQTFAVYRQRTFSHYEIWLAADTGAKTQQLIFLTNDEALYTEALTLEGTETRIDVSWRAGRRQTGQVAQLLTALRIHREAAA